MNSSYTQRANFATASRLLKCAINEGLVYATYHRLKSNIVGPAGVIYVLPNNKLNGDDIVENDCFIFVFTQHRPITVEERNSKNGEKEEIIERVTFVDPWDMIKPICTVTLKDYTSDDDNKSELLLLRGMKGRGAVREMEEIEGLIKEGKIMLTCFKSFDVIREVGASELMKILGRWLELDEDIMDMICEELESSVKFQGICNFVLI